ncbi:MAG TPA: hypothetical protein VFS29_10740, partial [Motilibacteraceae bacterium]|nr:hypothetical protein [Motilibacteraceae bacterium]
VCLVAAGRRPAGAPFPPRLAATITSLLIGMFLIAPFGKGHGRPPATERAAPWLVITEYCSWPLLGLAAWWLRRRRHRRVGDGDAVPAGRSRTEQPADASEPSLRALVVAAGVPVSVAVVLVGLGLHAGPPPRVVAAGRAAAPLTSPSRPIRLTVPELAGTTLAPQVATVRLRDAAAIPPAVLAGDLTRGPGPTTVWESGLQIVPTEGATESSLAFLTLDRLDPRTDVGAAAAHLRADGAALDGGWVDRVAGCGCVAVLDGHDLLVLRLEHPGPDQDAQLRRLATDLTPSRRAALVDAVTGVR